MRRILGLDVNWGTVQRVIAANIFNTSPPHGWGMHIFKLELKTV
jgi:hypothetical protein